MGNVYTVPALLTRLSASFTAMMVVVADSIAAHIIACVMLCSAVFFAMDLLRLCCVSLPVSSIDLSALCETSFLFSSDAM